MSDLIRTALVRVISVLLGRRAPGRHSNAYTPPAAPPAPRRRATPDVRGARLVVARRHRQERHAGAPYPPPYAERAEWFPPRDWEAEEAWDGTATMVRPYVAHLDVMQRTARVGTEVDPWGAVQ
ncbi:hypothetical protein ACH4UM_00620 [Streptomyces sp. NPDC020801]|uniref:hypothetical protein n=1 Tax=unclassified Streptomyces TaxID=2593676 RepID=UPI0037BBD7D8